MATGKSTSNNVANGDFKKPLTPAQIAAAQAQGIPTNESDIPDPSTNRTGYFNGTGFLPQLGNYGVDLLTAGPARRLGEFAADGDWSNFGAQAGNMGGTPYGAHIFGQADGQVLAPNSGAFAPAPTRAGSLGEFGGRAALGLLGGVSGAAVGQGLGNLATGGDRSGVAGGGAGGGGGQADIYGAANDIIGFGQQAAGMYGDAKNRALSYYGTANNIFNDTWGGGGGAPSGGGSALPPSYASPGLQGVLQGGPSPIQQRPQPGTGTANPYAPPTQLAQRNQAAQASNSGPTAAQAYYAAYAPTTTAQDQLTVRQRDGYGASAVADRYADQQGRQDTQTSSSVMMNYLAGYDPTQRGDNFSNGLRDANIGANAGEAQNRITSGQTSGGRLGTAVSRGQTGSGQFLGALTSGNSATGQYGSYLNSGNSDTGRFLAGFDPNSTRALDDTYRRIAAEGPSYEENFYNSQVAGDNPAYNQIRDDFVKDTQRAAAARGGFVAGSSMDYEQRGLTRLANEEFANRGKLAEAAGNARRGNLGLLNTAANNLDTNLLGRSQLVQKAGADREGVLGQMAMNRDTVTGSVIGNQEDLLGKLAVSGDSDYAKLASDRDANEMQRFDILGRTATAGDANALGLQNTRVTAASNQDQALQARANSINQLANWTSEDTMARGTALDALAGVASGESLANARDGGQLARNVDISNTDRQDVLQRAAQGASSEQAGNMKERFDQAMRLGDSQSAISSAMDMAAIGALTQSQVAALNAKLAAAGVSAAERAQLADAAAKGGAQVISMLGNLLHRNSGSSSGGVAGDGQAGGYIGTY